MIMTYVLTKEQRSYNMPRIKAQNSKFKIIEEIKNVARHN